jgi:hypothetical protein
MLNHRSAVAGRCRAALAAVGSRRELVTGLAFALALGALAAHPLAAAAGITNTDLSTIVGSDAATGNNAGLFSVRNWLGFICYAVVPIVAIFGIAAFIPRIKEAQDIGQKIGEVLGACAVLVVMLIALVVPSKVAAANSNSANGAMLPTGTSAAASVQGAARS